MNWAGILFYVFISLVGLAFGLMGYLLIHYGVAAGRGEGPRSKLYKAAAIAFAAAGVLIVVVAIWKCDPLLTAPSDSPVHREESAEERVPIVLGDVVLEPDTLNVRFRPAVPVPVVKTAAQQARPAAEIRETARPAGVADLGPPRQQPAFGAAAR